jgi:hypothetical protein
VQAFKIMPFDGDMLVNEEVQKTVRSVTLCPLAKHSHASLNRPLGRSYASELPPHPRVAPTCYTHVLHPRVAPTCLLACVMGCELSLAAPGRGAPRPLPLSQAEARSLPHADPLNCIRRGGNLAGCRARARSGCLGRALGPSNE